MNFNNIPSLVEQAEEALAPLYKKADAVAMANYTRVQRAFAERRVSERHFHPSTGYGYNDDGRATIDEVYATVFGAERALVRHSVISGTHALSAALFALTRPGHTLISVTGKPYDTLEGVIGIGDCQTFGSLRDHGVKYAQVELSSDPASPFDESAVINAIKSIPGEKLIYIQRSRGYSLRPSVNCAQIADIITKIKSISPETPVLVDNCYGEFTEEYEPTHSGADLAVGSLIKNPGGTLAPGGGYIAGRAHLVEACVRRMLAPGLQADLGASLGFNRLAFQGLFQAPQTVAQAIKGAVLAATFFKSLGYPVMPDALPGQAGQPRQAGQPVQPEQAVYLGRAEHAVQAGQRSDIISALPGRSDIVQAIRLDDPEKLIRFCAAIQQACPLDAAFTPEASMLPGYSHPVIMAGGGFIQGSSSELSADGPMYPPYIAYLQGGFSLAQIRLGLLLAAKALLPGDSTLAESKLNAAT